ncbi:MAG: NUDIX domain-containing protein [Methylobacteriaceae bacterium]|nr:NUDIX domain-containing protein [Methylobacteriaceae bacterium]
MPKRSAGLLLFRRDADGVRVFLVHPGGPFWQKRDAGSWSIPKGEYAAGEDARAVALREFEEETGMAAPAGDLFALGEVRQAGGKIVTAWALEGDIDPQKIVSNTFEMISPPKSGQRATFPEVDRAGWFTLAEAEEKLLGGQRPFLERLAAETG